MESVNEGSQTVQIEILVSSFGKKFDKLSEDPSFSYAASIYEVPQKLRKANEGAYTPRLVSIGPLHHGRWQLQDMEPFKLRFMHNFLTRSKVDLHTIAEFAAKEESFVRGCYEGTITLSPNRLAEVIMLDGIFIVALLLDVYFIQLRDENETIFDTHWVMQDLMHDMLLLENQMPIRIMEGLLSFVDLSSLNESEMVMVTIYDLAQKFFKIIGFTSKVPLAADHSKARHFVEFLLFLHDPPEGYVSSFDKRPRRQVESTDFCQNATELVKAGVVLRSSESNWLHEISFSYEDGVLTIPELTIDALTEPFFKNLIAFEHLGRYGYFSKKFTSYVMLLETLIRTPGDVDILVEVGIIENRFGSSRQVAALFNNLTRGILTEGVYDFYFYGLFMELKYYRRSLLNPGKGSLYRWRIILRVMSYKWNEWKWILGRDYFSNPWSTLSIVAGFLLLVLTLIQAVCSILQVA